MSGGEAWGGQVGGKHLQEKKGKSGGANLQKNLQRKPRGQIFDKKKANVQKKI
jgi:hypothetical protein